MAKILPNVQSFSPCFTIWEIFNQVSCIFKTGIIFCMYLFKFCTWSKWKIALSIGRKAVPLLATCSPAWLIKISLVVSIDVYISICIWHWQSIAQFSSQITIFNLHRPEDLTICLALQFPVSDWQRERTLVLIVPDVNHGDHDHHPWCNPVTTVIMAIVMMMLMVLLTSQQWFFTLWQHWKQVLWTSAGQPDVVWFKSWSSVTYIF